MNKQLLTESSVVGATLASIFITLVTLIGELYKVTGPDGKTMINPLKDFLKANLWHHWIGKGILAVVIFALVTILYYAYAKNTGRESKLGLAVQYLSFFVLIGGIVIYGFFGYEYLIAH